jgi:two-component system, LuxR family, response regulator FixJ
MNSEPTVFVVDDNQAMRSSLKWLIESVGLRVEVFASADEFLQRYYPGCPGCLLLDVRMPGMNGLELQECLRGCEKFDGRSEGAPECLWQGALREKGGSLAS